ncbi:uncharacterized protein LOC121694347 isoform X10 [Alosa sapidissima]|uniref:uncharacterized protein LOC121694347 isoform X10 n=1 Tax=Alosa sapidissima TaxID=34773 RepID=UPI001C09EA16|nr:uncharacterized protein LOC121694347 isoform X10 [Alosa sapidissima]
MSGCCVNGCTNRYSTGGLKFYRIPTGSRPFQSNRRRLWLQAIKREDWNENIIKNARVCSAHFISGEMSLDFSSPDFVPSVFTYTKQSQNPGVKMDRYHTKRKRDDRPGTAANQRVPSETPEQECSMDHCPGTLYLYHPLQQQVHLAIPSGDDPTCGSEGCTTKPHELMLKSGWLWDINAVSACLTVSSMF